MGSREPITWELRLFLADPYREWVPNKEQELQDALSAIDAVHAGLERENAELRRELAALDNRSESMHIGGSITDELRAWVRDGKGSLLAIADRIDAEHESACAEAYGNGVMSVPIALDESQWVMLPVDADGECIHVGDVMENIVCPSVHREVTGVGVECFYGWNNGNGRYSQFDANCYRHHHAPTVEDVLTEFGIDWEHEDNCEDRAALLKEYATKLRLAGDAE